MMLGPGFSAQCDTLTRTCVGVEVDGNGIVDRIRTFDGKPVVVCTQALMVVELISVVRELQCVIHDLRDHYDDAPGFFRKQPVFEATLHSAGVSV